MDPIFIYFNNLKLAENKQFSIELSNEDLFLFTHFTKNCLIMELHLKKNKQSDIAEYSLKTRKKTIEIIF